MNCAYQLAISAHMGPLHEPLGVLCLVVFVEGEQTIVEGPQESFVFLGQTVVLRCKVSNQITNTTVGDDDIYACQINEAASEPSVISNPAKLTVLIRPTPPKLQKTSHFMNAVAGEAVTQSCLSRKETSGVTQESLQAEVEEEIQKDGYGYIVSSNIRSSESDSLKLILQYAPRVNLTLASQQQLREGGSALLACNVDAKPLDNIRISWYKNGNQLLPHTTDRPMAFDYHFRLPKRFSKAVYGRLTNASTLEG
ncbi:hypothetical protein ANCCEY_13431 [Ancylostoma ceylanicum]|uniref:Ig-like domain-containing protein n=1 Tax=Ancylostoma ceylanicum TaxID=53326 RepID=A0A0D6L7J7_9BILA|nr:hypothetical protein ANCCEY_13431 [Ancylostoma ceylanicum]